MIPDAKTIWDFKQRLEENGREGSRKLFEVFNLQLEARGYIAREGSIIDASFTEAPRQRNSREQNQSIKEGGRPEEFDTNPAVGRQKDSEARWAKKNNEAHYGWKNHVKADLKTKLTGAETKLGAMKLGEEAGVSGSDGEGKPGGKSAFKSAFRISGSKQPAAAQ